MKYSLGVRCLSSGAACSVGQHDYPSSISLLVVGEATGVLICAFPGVDELLCLFGILLIDTSQSCDLFVTKRIKSCKKIRKNIWL